MVFRIRNYFFSGATGVACFGAAGVGVAGAAASVGSIVFNLLSPVAPVKLTPESKINAINIAESVQVLLSKKSVVF
jgi:hypothetical protein